MKILNEKTILVVFLAVYLSIEGFLYFEREKHVIWEAEKRIDIILKFNKALHKYVEDVQKPVIYDLKANNKLYSEFFDPKLLSFTYVARNIHNNYIEIESKDGVEPYMYKLAATNPRNPINKATEYEEKILQRFRKNEINKFTDILNENGKQYVYRAMPIAKSKDSCMLCHSTPDIAPKALIELYGSEGGFGEQIGDVRAMISLKIPISELLKSENERFFILSIIIFMVFVVLYIFIVLILRKDTKLAQEIEKNEIKEKKTRAILDSSPSIIVLNNGKEIVDANKTFFEFFEVYANLEEFKKKYECICDLFEVIDKKGYVVDKRIHGLPWVEYLILNKNQTFKAAMHKNEKLNHFILKAEKVELDSEFLVIVELINITQEIELEQQMKEQEEILHSQSKIVAMGEMIANIAHQWRQPLNTISTAATGMKVQKDFGVLEDKSFDESVELINSSTKYLSQIINDFAGYVKINELEELFMVDEMVNQALRILEGIIKSNNIVVCKEIEEGLILYGVKNEFVQIIINILNNANDKFLIHKPQNEEIKNFIKISAYRDNENIIVEICDNGDGVDESVMKKIFEPYFTTKHQSRGTGLGLFVTHKIVTSNFNGSIKAKNQTFQCHGNDYHGVCFIMRMPIPK